MTNRKKSKIDDPSEGVYSITEMTNEKIDQREREYTLQRFAELKEEAKDIKDLRDRLKFWSESQLEYKNRVHMDKFLDMASGAVSYAQGNRKLWLDILCENEIYHLNNLIQHMSPTTSTIEPPEHENQKVICLYELGVLGFLKKRLMTESYSTLSHIIAYFTNMNLANSKKCLERIDGNEYKKDQHIKEKQKIRDRYEIKPLPQISFDKDIE